MTTAALEDSTISKILAVTLKSSAEAPDQDPPVVYLAALAEELRSEHPGTEEWWLTSDILDRVLVSRLIENPPEGYPQPPLQYLLGCYARVSNALRTISPRQDAQSRQVLQQSALACKDLILSYAGLVLTGGVIPEEEISASRGPFQILDSMDAQESSSQPGVVPLPPGFLEDFSAGQDQDLLEQVAEPIAKELARRIQSQSPLGNYQGPMALLRYMVGIDKLAVALTSVRSFLPDLKKLTGRAIQLPGSSWLGPAFSVSVIPDQLILALPNIREQCFSEFHTRSQSELFKSMSGLRMAMKQIHGELHGVVKTLLGKSTRTRMVQWLGAVLDGNKERAKMQANNTLAASHGFFINFNAVMLKLCGPFMDPSNPAFWKRVDVRYIADNPRISFADDTKLAATHEEDQAYCQQVQEERQGTEEYHFICECFFLTYHSLHLGVIKVLQDWTEDLRRLQDATRVQQEVEAALQKMANTPQEALLKAKLRQIQNYVNAAQENRLCTETMMGDPELIHEVIAFYRLGAAWMMRLACPSGPLQMPLPEPAPAAFASLPEYFIEDLAEYLLYVSRMHPQLLVGAPMEEMMLFLMVFMGSPKYVRSPYLRSKLSEVVHVWLPPQQEGASFRRGFTSRSLGNSLTYLFEAHPLVLEHLVPTLLQLYVAIEFTDRANQFYLKFHMRQYIGDILHYLWGVPQHRVAWKSFALRDNGRGEYLRFCNMLINDAIYLLDESLKKLKDLRELESELGDSARVAALAPQERQEREQALHQTGEHLKSLLYLSSGTIRTLCTSTEEIQQPFLLPEMVGRTANMLGYFLLLLAGPQRRSFRVQDPEKYNFRPKDLLSQICSIYVHLYSGDQEGAFSRAVASDERSYRPEMFAEAARVLRQFGLLPEGEVMKLEQLASAVEEASKHLKQEEEFLANAPDDFMDPISCEIMKDPVLLPTSGTIMDRDVIVRHLLTDQRDPINRQPLTPDMLETHHELKAKITAWIDEQRSKMKT